MAVRGRACLVSSWRMSHFGIKPVSGGRPPSDRRIRGVRAAIAGIFAQEEASVLILVALFNLKTRNVEDVIIRYVVRAKSVRDGENCMIRIIQPKWAIEE